MPTSARVRSTLTGREGDVARGSSSDGRVASWYLYPDVTVSLSGPRHRELLTSAAGLVARRRSMESAHESPGPEQVVTRVEVITHVGDAFARGPQTRLDLVAVATRSGARRAVLDLLGRLPERRFAEPRDIWQGARRDAPPDRRPGPPLRTAPRRARMTRHGVTDTRTGSTATVDRTRIRRGRVGRTGRRRGGCTRPRWRRGRGGSRARRPGPVRNGGHRVLTRLLGGRTMGGQSVCLRAVRHSMLMAHLGHTASD